MEAFFVSLLAVAVGEIGDKTQLLSVMLAARYRKPIPIILGILVATLANHALAGLLGVWIREIIPPQYLRAIVATSFFVVALWALKPDTIDSEPVDAGRFGVFMVTMTSFFLAEIGDKTQIATIVLAARFDNLIAVIAGTTAGMLAADVPAVLIGHTAARRIPFKWMRHAAAALFAALGIVAWFAPRAS